MSMELREFWNVLAAIIVFAAIAGFGFAIVGNWNLVALSFLFSIIIIFVSVFSKKLMAYLLDSAVEHEIWHFQRFGFYPRAKFDKALPMGIIFPLFLSIFSLGILKAPTLLTYESRARKARASRRFGYYSFAEMTDWHNGIIGAAGIVGVLALSIITYFLPTNAEFLTKLAIYYAFWNILPFSNLDGSQIFFGSRTIWSILAAITLIFTILALATVI